jgi:uncharacterized membrane protein YeaQ/YmgE (transglycosylase-associated protein family)
MKTKSSFRNLMVCGLFFLTLNLVVVTATGQATGDPRVGDRTKAAVQVAQEKVKDATTTVTVAVQGASESVQDAGRSAVDSIKGLWSRIDDSRLKNRTRDEIVAWVIMGVLAGLVAGSFTSSGAGIVGRLLLGLAGAFLGGMAVHIARIDLGWGPVLIRYEELLFSLVGAVLLIVVARLIRSRVRKTPVEK